MKRYLGGFVSVAGGLKNGLINGDKLGINTIMMHPTPPQRWYLKTFDDKVVSEFNEQKKDSKVEKIFMHGIYLINLGNPDKQKFHLSKMALVSYLDLCERINGDGVIFHVGTFKDISEEDGFARIIKGINWIFNEHKGSSKLLLEVAAGSGSVVGSKLEDLARIYEGVENKERLGYCLDTQHLFASGYDYVNDLDVFVTEADKVLGLDKIHAIHFNDSKTEFNSKRDRHENIGEGLIGEKAMKAFLNHPKLKHIPVMMETPAMKGEIDQSNAEAQKLLSWGN